MNLQNDNLATAWLNDPSVREAIHAAPVLLLELRKLKLNLSIN